MEHMPPFFLHLKDWTLFMETAHRISNPPRAITADVQRDSLHIHPGVACCAWDWNSQSWYSVTPRHSLSSGGAPIQHVVRYNGIGERNCQ